MLFTVEWISDFAFNYVTVINEVCLNVQVGVSLEIFQSSDKLT